MGDDNQSAQGTVDYKTLFAGCCVLVSILGGTIWSMWNHAASEQVADNARINVEQWHRLRELNDQVIDIKSKQESIRKDIDDQESRFRALEHRR